jgi:hypothetical protein
MFIGIFDGEVMIPDGSNKGIYQHTTYDKPSQ